MEGNLVVRPIPASALDAMEQYFMYGDDMFQNDETDDEYADDEMFLDEDEIQVLRPSGKHHHRVNNVNEKFGAIHDDLPIDGVSRTTTTQTIMTPGGIHVVYRVNTSSGDDNSDYSMYTTSQRVTLTADRGGNHHLMLSLVSVVFFTYTTLYALYLRV